MREMRRKMIIRCRRTRLAAGSSCSSSSSSSTRHHCVRKRVRSSHTQLSRARLKPQTSLSISRSENYENHAKLPTYKRTTVTYTIPDDNVNQGSPPLETYQQNQLNTFSRVYNTRRLDDTRVDALNQTDTRRAGDDKITRTKLNELYHERDGGRARVTLYCRRRCCCCTPRRIICFIFWKPSRESVYTVVRCVCGARHPWQRHYQLYREQRRCARSTKMLN
ncbi:unnamed protein product [Trichogramma brassicae]|uniref:Uncharacterized protein n=1 Tax=Trichogramma brassicae TaxID=86971 RepID=A0A6H5I9A1_9HYME|nr:unnamed protein product [Trichogramma brassicae]